MKTIVPGIIFILFCVFTSCKKENIQPSDTVVGSSQRGDEVGGSNDGYSVALNSCTGLINSNFNGTPIKGGNYIWMHAHIKVVNKGSGPFSVFSTNGHVSFTSKGVDYNYNVPDGHINFTNSTSASANWDGSTWNINIPLTEVNNDEIFLTGFAIPVPAAGFTGGFPVEWTSSFTSSDPNNISIQWQWSAAVYTDFTTNYNNIGVTVLHNKEHAGAPTSYKRFVTGGARGGGGSNLTGSWSATGSSNTCLIFTIHQPD